MRLRQAFAVTARSSPTIRLGGPVQRWEKVLCAAARWGSFDLKNDPFALGAVPLALRAMMLAR